MAKCQDRERERERALMNTEEGSPTNGGACYFKWNEHSEVKEKKRGKKYAATINKLEKKIA